MKPLNHWIFAAACTLLTALAQAKEPPTEKPFARFTNNANGEVISEQDLADYLDVRIGLRAVARNTQGIEHVVREMAFMRVLNLEGERLGIARAGVSETASRFDDMYALAVQKKQEPVCTRPENEQQAHQYFDAHPQAFMVPAQARVLRIMLPHTAQIKGQSATEWLQAQAKSIAAGTSFAAVAEQAEQIEPLEVQGDLGWIPLDEDHPVIARLANVKAGELLGPLQEGDLVYLFQVTQQRPARPLAWEEAQSFAATRAETYCRETGEKQLRAQLFQKYGVEIDRAAIRAFFARTVPGR